MTFEDSNEEMDIETMNELLEMTGASFHLRADDGQKVENLETNTETEDFSVVGELTAEQMEGFSKLMGAPFSPPQYSKRTFSKETEQLALRLRLQESELYKVFDILEKPIPFKEFVEKFADGANIDFVQLHDITPIGENPDDVVGFCGTFAWKNNTLVSLDGDTYSDEMLVYGYVWFSNEVYGIEKGLDILVGDSW